MTCSGYHTWACLQFYDWVLKKMHTNICLYNFIEFFLHLHQTEKKCHKGKKTFNNTNTFFPQVSVCVCGGGGGVIKDHVCQTWH